MNVPAVGSRSGRLTVTSLPRTAQVYGRSRPVVDTICDCGKPRELLVEKFGTVLSCGCLRADTARARRLKHGHAAGKQSPEYQTWKHMIARCENPAVERYESYGGRGIKVCERWRASFEAFLEDMGPKPSPKHSIERKESDGNYEPGNCIWATRKQQDNNKTNSARVTAFGQTRTVAEWTELLGFPRTALRNRLRAGWAPEDALTRPLARGTTRAPIIHPRELAG